MLVLRVTCCELRVTSYVLRVNGFVEFVELLSLIESRRSSIL